MPKKQTKPTDLKEETSTFVAKLLQLLKLTDWDISVRLVSSLPGGDVGYCKFNLYHRTARIRVVRPKRAFPLSDPKMREFRTTLIHEIVHLLFAKPMAGSPPNSKEYQKIALENSVESVVYALDQLLFSDPNSRIGVAVSG